MFRKVNAANIQITTEEGALCTDPLIFTRGGQRQRHTCTRSQRALGVVHAAVGSQDSARLWPAVEDAMELFE
ncbi:MAG: hypothetical protein KDA45_10320 [Planctomycetales bacterium]|nr:hypothetical protein [Planctomycetales bacterium]